MGGKEKVTNSRSEQEESASARPKCVSEYEESDDEIHTPNDNKEEDISRRKRTLGGGGGGGGGGGWGEVVNENTDFSTFQ